MISVVPPDATVVMRASDAARLFERFKKTQQRQTRAKFLQVMFMRLPLLNPDRFLVRTLPFIRPLIGPIGAILWLVVVGLGLKMVFENFDALKQQSEGMLKELPPSRVVTQTAGDLSPLPQHIDLIRSQTIDLQEQGIRLRQTVCGNEAFDQNAAAFDAILLTRR